MSREDLEDLFEAVRDGRVSHWVIIPMGTAPINP